MSSDDIFQSIRDAVDQTVEMAEATSKISEETMDTLAELTLTRRGDGEVMLDISALERMKAMEHQWSQGKKNPNDYLVNPTRLPQLIPGINGLTSSQYLAFVQRPLELNGDNGPFLERKSLKLYKEYQPKERAKERNQIFGPYQRMVANLLIDEVLQQEKGETDKEALAKLRETMTPQEQFKLAAKALGITTSEVMDRLYKYSVALGSLESIKTKIARLEKNRSNFEAVLRKMASQNTGPASNTRIKDLFLGFQGDLEKMVTMAKNLNRVLLPLIEKTKSDQFEETFSTLHREAAKLDAIVARWVIIIGEANNNKSPCTAVEKIKGMHRVLKS